MEQKAKPVAKTPEKVKMKCHYCSPGHPQTVPSLQEGVETMENESLQDGVLEQQLQTGAQSMKQNKKQQLKITMTQ